MNKYVSDLFTKITTATHRSQIQLWSELLVSDDDEWCPDALYDSHLFVGCLAPLLLLYSTLHHRHWFFSV